jgi:hypothetical protein
MTWHAVILAPKLAEEGRSKREMKPDQGMDGCMHTHMHACMAEGRGHTVRRAHLTSRSLFSPAFDPRACQRASATHRNAATPFPPTALGRSTPSECMCVWCATGVLFAPHKPVWEREALGNRGMRRRRFFSCGALCSLVA